MLLQIEQKIAENECTCLCDEGRGRYAGLTVGGVGTVAHPSPSQVSCHWPSVGSAAKCFIFIGSSMSCGLPPSYRWEPELV